MNPSFHQPRKGENLMRHAIALLSITVFTAALGGCSQDTGPYGGKSYNWYQTHIKEAKAESAWCGNQPNALKIDSCTLAGRAIDNAQLNNFFKNDPSQDHVL
jgi:hypothetical protein